MRTHRLDLLERSVQDPAWHLGACPRIVGICYEKHRLSVPTGQECLNRAHLAMEIFGVFRRGSAIIRVGKILSVAECRG